MAQGFATAWREEKKGLRRMQTGERVVLGGLEARRDLNGKHGTTQSFDAAKQRFEVLLDDGGVSVKVKAEKLSVVRNTADNSEGCEFLAACDETGVELRFGDWWHRKAGAVEQSYDLCDAAYQRLAKEQRDEYVRINSISDMHAHMGPPPPTECMPELDGDALQHALGDLSAGAAAAPEADELGSSSSAARASAAIDALLAMGVRELRVADVLAECARLQNTNSEGAGGAPGADEEAVALRALIRAAKQKSGMHFSRGGEAPADCVLTCVDVC
jgi:hypothetical protein